MTRLAPGSPAWPAALDELAAPPPALHVRPPGDGARLAELLRPPVVAIVGTRKATAGGAAFARRLAHDLARVDACVVSGLAAGIDAAAHAGALDGGGRTIAVLGCGVDRDYPRANAGLAARIAADGAVLSEYEPGTPPGAVALPGPQPHRGGAGAGGRGGRGVGAQRRPDHGGRSRSTSAATCWRCRARRGTAATRARTACCATGRRR